MKRTGLLLGIAAVALGVYLAGIQATGNFATVVAGEVYRSNQPTADDLAAYVKRYKIRTVVNLRGRRETAGWYRNEAAAAKRLGVGLVDFPMQSDRRLDVAAAERLVTILRTVPRPILIHCRSGADRTGLVAVVYLSRIAGVDGETAERQLSLRYGHIGIPFLSSAYAMDESWEALEEVWGIAG